MRERHAGPDGRESAGSPAAKAHGAYTAAQVRSAYQTTRKLLIAGNLDWPTLHGGTPAAFADLLNKRELAQFEAGLHTTALYQDGAQKNTRTWLMSDDPGGALEPWISIGSETAGGQCGVRDGYIHPQFPHGPPPSVRPSGTPQDPYSLATPHRRQWPASWGPR